MTYWYTTVNPMGKTGWINVVSTSFQPKTSMQWRWINMENWLDFNVRVFRLLFVYPPFNLNPTIWWNVLFNTLVDNSTQCKLNLHVELKSVASGNTEESPMPWQFSPPPCSKLTRLVYSYSVTRWMKEFVTCVNLPREITFNHDLFSY
jgi:hypothetical protein